MANMAFRRLGKAAYFVAFVLVATSALDYATTIWPLRPADVSWRYGAVGILSGFLLTPLLGVLVALVIATVLDHPGTLKVLAILSGITGIVGLLLLLGFALDAIQMYQAGAPDARPAAKASSLRASIKLLAGFTAFVWLGVAGFRRRVRVGV